MAGRERTAPLTLAECYETLGVERDATPQDLRRAYRRRLMRVHPDLNGGDHSRVEQFERLRRAYAVLEGRRRGMHLHGEERRRHVRREGDAAEGGDPAIPPPIWTDGYRLWRGYGFLAALVPAIVFGLIFNGGAAGPRVPYYDLYLGATAAAGVVWAAGLGLLWRRRRRREREETR